MIVDQYARHVNPAFVKLLGVFGYGRIFVKAQGTRLWDSEGREYLDCLAGFGSTNLGHRHPTLVQKLCDELTQPNPDLLHIGPSRPMAQLAERLTRLAGPPFELVLFSTSGGEAVESALKLARAATRRSGFVFCQDGFHGTGLGPLSVMGAPRLRAPFEPLLSGCRAIPFGDMEALRQALHPGVAAFLVEPMQGEGGARPAPPGYLREACRLCQANGSLFLLDEVQTGLGRTGSLFAYQQEGVVPDAVILGKALGGGVVPVSATLTSAALHRRAYGTMESFDLHGSTFSGYALGCAAAWTTLQILEDEQLVENARARGLQLLSSLQSRLHGHPLVREVRGHGLLVGIELGQPQSVLAQALSRNVFGQWLAVRLLERGIICQPAALRWDVLKLEPPLTIKALEIDHIVDQVVDVLDHYRELAPLLSDVAERLGRQFLAGWKFPQ